MNKKTGICLLYLILFCGCRLFAQQPPAAGFKVIPLGIRGGLDESNLSSYLIAPAMSDRFICADAGTIRHGIDVAIAAGSLKGTPDDILKNHIKGYLVSHGHLDHVAGLIMNSPEDSPKNIYALPSVVDVLKDKYFTWKTWANFTNEGDMPHLNKYAYVYLKEKQETDLAGTDMKMVAFPLSHGPSYQSTAFLISHNDQYLLYLGDTGSDEIEKSNALQQLWEQVAPLIVKGQLKAIFIETSFFDKQPDKLLFGHLTPRLLMQEMDKLAKLSSKKSLQKVSVVITHMKSFGSEAKALAAELQKDNLMKLKLVFPVQGQMLRF